MGDTFHVSARPLCHLREQNGFRPNHDPSTTRGEKHASGCAHLAHDQACIALHRTELTPRPFDVSVLPNSDMDTMVTFSHTPINFVSLTNRPKASSMIPYLSNKEIRYVTRRVHRAMRRRCTTCELESAWEAHSRCNAIMTSL